MNLLRIIGWAFRKRKFPPTTAIGAWWTSGEGVVVRYLTGIALFIGLCYGILAWQEGRLENKWKEYEERGGTKPDHTTGIRAESGKDGGSVEDEEGG